MSLARVTTWVPGQVLTASALNGEVNNILNNPISLISPTTGAINFNLQAHTNLLPATISATSGTAGQAIVVSGTQAVWGAPTAPVSGPASFTTLSSGQLLIGTSSGAAKSLNIGTTGQVLAVTSSNSDPAWQVIPLDGGLSSAAGSTGTLYYVSSSGVLTPLGIGTANQVLTVISTLPSWQTPSASAGGGGLSTSTVTIFDEMAQAEQEGTNATAQYRYGDIDGAFGLKNFSSGAGQPATVVSLPSGASIGTLGLLSSATPVASYFLTSLVPDMTIVMGTRSVNGKIRIGITTSFFTSGEPTDGIYWRTTGTASTWFAVCREGGTSHAIATTAVGSTDLQIFRITVTATGGANIITNGVTNAVAFTSSQVPPAASTGHTFCIGSSEGVTDRIRVDAWQITQNRSLKI